MSTYLSYYSVKKIVAFYFSLNELVSAITQRFNKKNGLKAVDYGAYAFGFTPNKLHVARTNKNSKTGKSLSFRELRSLQ